VRQLTAETSNGTTTYEFYDPEFCHCTYVGGVADEHQQLLRASLSGVSDTDPALWGPWSPEGLDVK